MQGWSRNDKIAITSLIVAVIAAVAAIVVIPEVRILLGIEKKTSTPTPGPTSTPTLVPTHSPIDLTPPPVSAQSSPPGRCSNNDTFRCAELTEIGRRTEGVMDGSKNRGNYFMVEIPSSGKYRVAVYKEVASPWYSLIVYDVDQKEVFKKFVHGKEETIEFGIDASGKYFILFYNYPGGGPVHSFDFTIQRQR